VNYIGKVVGDAIIGTAVWFFVLGLAVGVGGTLLVQHVSNYRVTVERLP